MLPRAVPLRSTTLGSILLLGLRPKTCLHNIIYAAVVYVILLLYIAVLFSPNKISLFKSEADAIRKTDVKILSKVIEQDNFFENQQNYSSPFFIIQLNYLLPVEPFNENIFYP